MQTQGSVAVKISPNVACTGPSLTWIFSSVFPSLEVNICEPRLGLLGSSFITDISKLHPIQRCFICIFSFNSVPLGASDVRSNCWKHRAAPERGFWSLWPTEGIGCCSLFTWSLDPPGLRREFLTSESFCYWVWTTALVFSVTWHH